MSGVALKPRKRIRHEILSLVPLAVVAGALFFAFPFATLGMKRPDNAVGPTGNPSCVYVELTDEEESWAMSIVRSGISTDVRSVRDLRADLSLSIIPEREHSFVMDVNDRKRASDLSKPNIEIISLPESMRDSEPVQIQPAADPGTGNAFSKEEMLKLID